MSSNKYTKLGITIFAAIVCAGIVLTLVQRWMYASNLEKAQAQYLKMQEQAAAKNREFAEQVKQQQLRKLETQINGNGQIATFAIQDQKRKEEQERRKRQREFEQERSKRHNGYMSTKTDSSKSTREFNRQKKAQENARKIAKLRQENERRRSSQKTNNETCKYWRSEYEKVRSNYNKNNMEAACRRARGY